MRKGGQIIDLDLDTHFGEFRRHLALALQGDEGEACQRHGLARRLQGRDRVGQAVLVKRQALGADDLAQRHMIDRCLRKVRVERGPGIGFPEERVGAYGQFHRIYLHVFL